MTEEEATIMRNAIVLIMTALRDSVGREFWDEMARAYMEKMSQARRAPPQGAVTTSNPEG